MLRISIALFLAGFATFSLVYSTQPLLPEFSAEFGVDPATSSLSLSLTTGFLAFSILCSGALSETLGRRGLMFASICCAAVLNFIASVAPTWELLLLARALVGIVIGGVPAVAMAYLAEEMPPWRLGLAMGLYVAGNAFGGMIGRVAVGALTEHYSWRTALEVVSVIDLIVAFGFLLLLPPSRNFIAQKGLGLMYHLAAWKGHLGDKKQILLFVTAFLGVGSFVTVYNYMGFRLLDAPFNLTHSQVGLIFFSYIFGMLASSLAGGLADKLGRGPVMLTGCIITLCGIACTLSTSLAFIITGIAFVTFGFFAVHSVASSWVGKLAIKNKSHASSLYLLCYYIGSSVLGSLGGWFWHWGGWSAVAGFCGAMGGLVLVAGIILAFVRDETYSSS
ncbi:MFS transporter [Microvirga sp. W0021]|uniref:MFS transporter n=1 Tax=Hohaiivirga grylli TaxID=3133970 RepID=A0ABV0BLH7_9HYPH